MISNLKYLLLYPPQPSCGGGGYTGISLSVRPSVCLSVVRDSSVSGWNRLCLWSDIYQTWYTSTCNLNEVKRSWLCPFWGQFVWFWQFPDELFCVYHQISTKPSRLVHISIKKCCILFGLSRSRSQRSWLEVQISLKKISAQNWSTHMFQSSQNFPWILT